MLDMDRYIDRYRDISFIVIIRKDKVIHLDIR
jgi:hypothetical protein